MKIMFKCEFIGSDIYELSSSTSIMELLLFNHNIILHEIIKN